MVPTGTTSGVPSRLTRRQARGTARPRKYATGTVPPGTLLALDRAVKLPAAARVKLLGVSVGAGSLALSRAVGENRR